MTDKNKNDANQSASKTPSQFNFTNYKKERDAFWLKFYPASRTIFKILDAVNSIVLIGFIAIITFACVQAFGMFGLLVGTFLLMLFLPIFLIRENLLFNIDKNFFIYKQSEKYLKN
tara:strand:+ start:565 stop:912 length:348 start_codon:yes stop_codon:yes gene_type:complete